MDEHEAIARLKRGDLAGLEVLVSLYQLQAIRAACLIVGEPAQAEDIVQNAFIRAVERFDQFDQRRPFGPWFLRSVVYDAIKVARRQKRQVSLEAGEADDLFDFTDPTPLPEELVEAEEMRQTVWRALQALAPRQRAVVVLRYYLGLSETDIRDRFNSPIGTIKWQLHNARKRLKRLLNLELSEKEEQLIEEIRP